MEFGMQVCPPRLNGSKGPPPLSTGSAATIDTRRAEMRSGSAAPQAQESVTRPPGGATQTLRELNYTYRKTSPN
jgi:hypothetical protein